MGATVCHSVFRHCLFCSSSLPFLSAPRPWSECSSVPVVGSVGSNILFPLPPSSVITPTGFSYSFRMRNAVIVWMSVSRKTGVILEVILLFLLLLVFLIVSLQDSSTYIFSVFLGFPNQDPRYLPGEWRNSLNIKYILYTFFLMSILNKYLFLSICWLYVSVCYPRH